MSTNASFLELARGGLRAALSADLILHEEPGAEAARRDGQALANVLERAARRWDLPVAFPLMDLRLEKADLLGGLRLNEDEAERFHMGETLDNATWQLLRDANAPLSPGSQARDEALSILANETDLLPVGMTIGPFSLTTKLLADPITATALAGRGVTPEEDPQVRLLRDCLEVAEAVVWRSVARQLRAGARAMMLCEPTAGIAYLSPRQIRAGSDVFERLVLEPNLKIKALLDDSKAELFFHDCGELTEEMVHAFGHRLRPAVLSLGSSRHLWEDARRVPDTVVLYGNLPSKSFYSDSVMPVEEVQRRTADLIGKMRDSGHPFILGSECDVLHVPDAAGTIRRKVEAMMTVPESLTPQARV